MSSAIKPPAGEFSLLERKWRELISRVCSVFLAPGENKSILANAQGLSDCKFYYPDGSEAIDWSSDGTVTITGTLNSTGSTSAENDPVFTTWLGTSPLSGLLPTSHLTDFAHANIAHSNRTALDNVSGVNTGDQSLAGLLPTSHLSDFVHADIAHTNRAALNNVSGVNTGDQDLSAFVRFTYFI